MTPSEQLLYYSYDRTLRHIACTFLRAHKGLNLMVDIDEVTNLYKKLPTTCIVCKKSVSFEPWFKRHEPHLHIPRIFWKTKRPVTIDYIYPLHAPCHSKVTAAESKVRGRRYRGPKEYTRKNSSRISFYSTHGL